MGRIRITGGIPLDGEVRIQGSKNAALPIMAAALLNRGTTVLKGCPRIADVFLMEQMLREETDFWFGGSPSEMMSALFESREISKEEIAKMRSILDVLDT